MPVLHEVRTRHISSGCKVIHKCMAESHQASILLAMQLQLKPVFPEDLETHQEIVR